jgi:hypothetical protein
MFIIYLIHILETSCIRVFFYYEIIMAAWGIFCFFSD